MILCLDIGNSHITGGVFENDNLKLQFRRTSKDNASSDEIGVFLRSVLKENGIAPGKIQNIAVCTVVPELTHSLRNAFRKYFSNINPFFLQAGVKTGLNIKYRNPLELGSDRIANAIAAGHLYPNENLIVVDMGTATTVCAINAEREFLGGVIIPGILISMQSLESNTAKLPSVEIVKSSVSIGRSTIEGIQSGLYLSAIGALKEIIARQKDEAFGGEDCRVLGTGGFASLFSDSGLFDDEISDLVLKGVYLAFNLNTATKGKRYENQHAEV